MEIGTLKPGFKPGRKKIERLVSGGPGGPGGGKDNGGGPHHDDEFQPDQYPSSKSRILSLFLLLVVLMTFAGLIGAYIVVSTNNVLEWKPFNLPFQVWISTVLILMSSLTYGIAQKSIAANDHQKSKTFLLATAILGGMFIASQLLAWFALVRRGVYMASNPYAGFFYILTALHAVHVIGGIIALGYIILRNWRLTTSDEESKTRREVASAVGLYWHFMDGLWIVLLVLLGFWK